MSGTAKTLRVNLKNNAYNIYTESLPFNITFLKKAGIAGGKVFIVTDSNVAKLYLQSAVNAFKKQNFNAVTAVITAGEEGKNLNTLGTLYDKALSAGLDRKSLVVALGGGVVGDIAGFFAATYMRGVGYVQMPTTLLAMADSSVGGKTAVNVSGGKNIAGAFYQPKAVYINTRFLESLPARQIKNGFAEIVKYALAMDAKFFNSLEKVFSGGVITPQFFAVAVAKSCAHKARVVELDEKETKGVREVLNFGHTLAHAVETYTCYKKYLHGEAVIFGMAFAAMLSAEAGLCGAGSAEKIKTFLTGGGFQIKPDVKISPRSLLKLMKKDKKALNGKIKFTLLTAIGKAKCGVEVADAVVLKTLNKYFGA